jgi:hypothetical protein
MLFRGSKAKDMGVFRQVAIEEAEAFDQSMRDPTVDIYACLVNFVGQSAPVRPELAQLPSQYAEYADVASEDNAKALAEHSSHDLAIDLAPET